MPAPLRESTARLTIHLHGQIVEWPWQPQLAKFPLVRLRLDDLFSETLLLLARLTKPSLHRRLSNEPDTHRLTSNRMNYFSGSLTAGTLDKNSETSLASYKLIRATKTKELVPPAQQDCRMHLINTIG